MYKYVLAIDPGRYKCGIAVVNDTGECKKIKNIDVDTFEKEIGVIIEDFFIDTIIIGNGTGSIDFINKIYTTFKHINIEIIDETNTTFLAKKLYWEMNKPKGLNRLLPLGMRTLPEPVDAYAALLLAKKWLENKINK